AKLEPSHDVGTDRPERVVRAQATETQRTHFEPRKHERPYQQKYQSENLQSGNERQRPREAKRTESAPAGQDPSVHGKECRERHSKGRPDATPIRRKPDRRRPINFDEYARKRFATRSGSARHHQARARRGFAE